MMKRHVARALSALAAVTVLCMGLSSPAMAADDTGYDNNSAQTLTDPSSGEGFSLSPNLEAKAAATTYCNVYDNVTPSAGGWYRIPASTSSAGFNCVLETGVTGQGVWALQWALNSCYGAGLALDSDFGPATYAALLSAQSAEGISVDGVYGSQSRTYLKWPSRTTVGNCAHGYSFGF